MKKWAKRCVSDMARVAALTAFGLCAIPVLIAHRITKSLVDGLDEASGRIDEKLDAIDKWAGIQRD